MRTVPGAERYRRPAPDGLATDAPAVVFGDDEGRRSRAGAATFGPVGSIGRGRAHERWVELFAGVLDVDEQRLAVRCFGDAR